MVENTHTSLPLKIYNCLTTFGFATLFILFFYDLRLAVILITLTTFCGLKFICILITLIHGTFVLTVATLLALVILLPYLDNLTFIFLILISIASEYTVISMYIQKIGIDEKFSNLNLHRLLQFTAVNAIVVVCAVSCGFFWLESPPASALLLFGFKVILIKFLSPLLVFRALSFFH